MKDAIKMLKSLGAKLGFKIYMHGGQAFAQGPRQSHHRWYQWDGTDWQPVRSLRDLPSRLFEMERKAAGIA
jgi:hypothetical protein